jgi:hypothetical protein
MYAKELIDVCMQYKLKYPQINFNNGFCNISWYNYTWCTVILFNDHQTALTKTLESVLSWLNNDYNFLLLLNEEMNSMKM